MRVSRRSLLKGVVAAGAAAAVPAEAQARERVAPHPEAVGVLYDSTMCAGCRGCVVACKEANDLPWDAPEALSSTTKAVVERREAPTADGKTARVFVKRQCMHCVDAPCVSACMLGALHKEGEGKRDSGGERKGTGIVLYDKSLCIGCRYCQIACPYAVPKFEWFETMPRIVKCELCRQRADPSQTGARSVANPACAQVCPTGALVYGRRAELLADAKARIAAQPQRYAPRIFGESDGGGTQMLYLAAAEGGFDALGLPKLPQESNAHFSEKVSHAPYLHGLTPVALYAAAAFLVRRNHERPAEAPLPHEEKESK